MNQQDNDENEAFNTLAWICLGFFLGFLFWPGCASADMRELSEKTRLAQDCPPYHAEDYPYPAAVEQRIVWHQEGIFSPYSLRVFKSIKQTDIEHIVPRHVAHLSGLCRASADRKREFATDMENLTLAAPKLNRHQKSDKGPSEWLPRYNQCWYAGRWEAVGAKYGLTYPRNERLVLDFLTFQCGGSTIMVRPKGY